MIFPFLAISFHAILIDSACIYRIYEDKGKNHQNQNEGMLLKLVFVLLMVLRLKYKYCKFIFVFVLLILHEKEQNLLLFSVSLFIASLKTWEDSCPFFLFLENLFIFFNCGINCFQFRVFLKQKH